MENYHMSDYAVQAFKKFAPDAEWEYTSEGKFFGQFADNALVETVAERVAQAFAEIGYGGGSRFRPIITVEERGVTVDTRALTLEEIERALDLPPELKPDTLVRNMQALWGGRWEHTEINGEGVYVGRKLDHPSDDMEDLRDSEAVEGYRDTINAQGGNGERHVRHEPDKVIVNKDALHEALGKFNREQRQQKPGFGFGP